MCFTWYINPMVNLYQYAKLDSDFLFSTIIKSFLEQFSISKSVYVITRNKNRTKITSGDKFAQFSLTVWTFNGSISSCELKKIAAGDMWDVFR